MASSAELTSPETRLVEWARVSSLCRMAFHVNWLEPDHWEVHQRHLRVRIFNQILLVVPFCTLEEETMDVYAYFGSRFYIFLLHSQDIGLESKGIDGCHSSSSVCLESCSHKTLREEESRQPKSLWGTVVAPVGHKLYTQDDILYPRAKRFQRWVTKGGTKPLLRHFVVQKGVEKLLKLLGHHESACNSFLEIL